MTNPLKQVLMLLTAFAVLLSLTEGGNPVGYFTTARVKFESTRRRPWTSKSKGQPLSPQASNFPFLPRAPLGSFIVLDKVGDTKDMKFVPIIGKTPPKNFVPFVEFGPGLKWHMVPKEKRKKVGKIPAKGGKVGQDFQPKADALLTIGYYKGGKIQVDIPNSSDFFNAKMKPKLGRRFQRWFLQSKYSGYRFQLDAIPLFSPRVYASPELALNSGFVTRLMLDIIGDTISGLVVKGHSVSQQRFINKPRTEAIETMLELANRYFEPMEGLDETVKKTYCEALFHDDVFLALVYPGAENPDFPEKFMLNDKNRQFGWENWSRGNVKSSVIFFLQPYLKQVQKEAKKACPLNGGMQKISLYNLKKWKLLGKDTKLEDLYPAA